MSKPYFKRDNFIGSPNDYVHNYHPLIINEDGTVYVSWGWQRGIIESEKHMSLDELIKAIDSVTCLHRGFKVERQHRYQWAKEYYLYRLKERFNEKEKA